MSRRDALWIGNAGMLSFFQAMMSRGVNASPSPGMPFPDGPSPDTSQPTTSIKHPGTGKGKQCIMIWLDGGPSHLDMWDIKPDAPVEVRGPLRAISTSIPGFAISECLPRMAQRLHRTCLIRSVTSPLGEHNLGTHYMMTGYKPSPVIEYASVGSVLAFHRKESLDLPAYVAVPHFHVGGSSFSGHGFLSSDCAPFSVMSDPAEPNFRLPWDSRSNDNNGSEPNSLHRRRLFSQQVDRFYLESDQTTNERNNAPESFRKAFQLLSSPVAREAFRIDKEAVAARDRYGRKTIGQSCLLARRLIERGVPFVTVNSTGWDTHADLSLRLRDGFTGAKPPVGLLPALDQALSALIDDLSDRHLLDQTLVVVMGEFGRTPKINTSGGRDHWPRVFSVFMAGGGLREGIVYGASDATGESPASNPVSPEDLIATMYHLLGIDNNTALQTADGRPIRLVPESGQILHDVITAAS